MAYLYKNNFDSLDGLHLVVQSINNFTQDRFVSAIGQKRHFDVNDAITMDNMVLQGISQLQDQYNRLIRFSQTFNEEFATECNEYFNLAHSMLNKIHTGTKQMKFLHTRFTPNSSARQKPLPSFHTQSSLYAHSPLGLESYNIPLYPLDSYPEPVQQLFRDMERFFRLMYDALMVCVDVIKTEQRIRNNPEQCQYLYNVFKENHLKQIMGFLGAIDITSIEFSARNNPAIALRENAQSEADFSQKGFHKLHKSDVCVLSAKEWIEESLKGDFTTTEIALFGKDKNKVQKIRYIVNHLDNYVPNEYKRKKLPSKLLAALRLWSQPSIDKVFVNYVNDGYTKANGTHEVISNGAVNHAKFNNENDTDYINWKNQWDNLTL